MLSILFANKPYDCFLYLFALGVLSIIPFFVIDFYFISGALLVANISWASNGIPILYFLHERNQKLFSNIPTDILRKKITPWLINYLIFPFSVMILQVWGKGDVGFGIVQFILAISSIAYALFSLNVAKAIFITEYIRRNTATPNFDDLYFEIRKAFINSFK